jgi:hypothetical protein
MRDERFVIDYEIWRLCCLEARIARFLGFHVAARLPSNAKEWRQLAEKQAISQL